VVIVEGILDINFEYNRKNIRSRKIIIASLTKVRDQAKDMGLFDGEKRISQIAQKSEEDISSSQDTSILNSFPSQGKEAANFEVNLEEKITENKLEKAEKNQHTEITKYIVEIPK